MAGRSLLHPFRRRVRRPPPGSAPGTLTAHPGAGPPRIHILGYGPEGCEEKELGGAEELREHLGRWPVLWANVDGVGHPDTLREVGEVFGLHGLALEDVADVPQRAKVEDYEGHLFVVARMTGHESPGVTEQLSLFLGDGVVLTFQEREGDPLDPVRERIRRGSGRIRHMGADYLAYAVLDAVVDYYFPVLEGYADRLDELEEEILASCSRETMGRLHSLKRELVGLRRAIWPMRDMVNSLLRDDHPRVSDTTRVFLRDLYDHTVQAIDLVETCRDLAASLTDLYLSTTSNRMNEIMKVLTMFSALFIPLSFIAGVYGMNFDTGRSPLNMPELHWYWGYPFALSLMAAFAVGLLLYFRRKGWVGGE